MKPAVVMSIAILATAMAPTPGRDPSPPPIVAARAGFDSSGSASEAHWDAAIDSLDRLGEFAAAARLALAQLERYRQNGDDRLLIASSSRVARLQVQQGDYPEAIQHLSAALEMCDRTPGIENRTRSEILATLGRAEKDRGLYDMSAEHYEQAIALARRDGSQGLAALARALTGKGNLIRRRAADRPAAAALFEEALKICPDSSTEDRSQVSGIRMDLALVLIQMGRVAEAERQLHAALPVVLELKGKEHADVGFLYSLLGWTHYLRHRYREAETSFARAVMIAEAARLHSDSGGGRRRYTQRAAANLAGCMLAQGRGKEAWQVFEDGLSGYLLDRLRAHQSRSVTIRPASSTRGDFLTELQATLDERTALVGWLEVKLVDETPIETWGWVLRHRGAVQWTRLWTSVPGSSVSSSMSGLALLVLRDSRWPMRVTTTDDIEKAARAAYQERFAGLEPDLRGIDRLVAVNASSLPIEALVDSAGRFLLDRFAISYAPSARVFLELQGRAQRPRTEGPDRGLLVRARGDESFAVLSGMDRETKEIAAILPDAQRLTVSGAQESTLQSMDSTGALARFAFIHFATHAVRGPQWPGFGALVLGANPDDSGHRTMPARAKAAASTIEENPGDGMLTASEIERWSIGPALVVLSGCQTSGYQFFGTLPGPAESFFIAGASGVIVSLWNVEDRSTYLLMTRFYRDLASASGANGSSRGAAWALRDAKQWVRDYVDRDGRTPFRNPAYWAGFVLIGGDPLVGRRVAPAQ